MKSLETPAMAKNVSRKERKGAKIVAIAAPP
jgi:hypothetical protein